MTGYQKFTAFVLACVLGISMMDSALAHGFGERGQGQMPMMGQGYQGQMPMMGRGYQGQMPMMGRSNYWQMQPLEQDLTVDAVQHMMEHRLSWNGNPNLQVGKVTEKDDDTIGVEVVTKEGSLVQKLEVNRHTGLMQPVQ